MKLTYSDIVVMKTSVHSAASETLTSTERNKMSKVDVLGNNKNSTHEKKYSNSSMLFIVRFRK